MEIFCLLPASFGEAAGPPGVLIKMSRAGEVAASVLPDRARQILPDRASSRVESWKWSRRSPHKINHQTLTTTNNQHQNEAPHPTTM